MLSAEETSEDRQSETSLEELLLAQPRQTDRESTTPEELLEAFGGVYAMQ